MTPRRILAYGDSNTWGWKPIELGTPTNRYDDGTRWPGVLRTALRDCCVEVDGLSGRTTDIDLPEPNGPLPGSAFNGARDVGAAVARATPLDLVIVMLGTNDLRDDLARTPERIAEGAATAAKAVLAVGSGIHTTYPPPRLLMVVPPPLGDCGRSPGGDRFIKAGDTSRRLASAFAAALAGLDAPLFDAGVATPTSGVDGVHFSAEDHLRLGLALAAAIRAF